jgi:hypothetical protein
MYHEQVVDSGTETGSVYQKSGGVMSATLKVVDEQFRTGGSPLRRVGVHLQLASERVSAREIIRSRVAAEVEELNRKRDAEWPMRIGSYIVGHGEGSHEAMLNSAPSMAPHRARRLDIEAETERAILAFNRHRFIMLLDDRQIDDLDEIIGLRPASEVVFVHLTPLKGG